MSHARRSGFRWIVLAGLVAPLVLHSSAHAGGFERTSPGARANGRAGADHVGGDSPMSLMYNPANILVGSGLFRIEGALHLHFSERCMQRNEVNEDPGTGERTAGTVHPNVCSEGGASVIPQLAASLRVLDKLAIGFGVYVPPAASRVMHFGDPETGRYDPDGQGGDDPVLTPTRYLLIEQELLQAFLTTGVAYQPHERFRIGATFGWGFTKVDYASASFSRTPITVSGIRLLEAESDVHTALEALDAFVPRIQLGAWGQPIRDLPLEFGASFHWTQNVKTSNGTLNVRTLETRLPAWAQALVTEPIEAEGTIEGVRLEAPQISTLNFGVRYAKKLTSPADNIGDRLSTERFDIELDVIAAFHSRVQQFTVTPPPGAGLDVAPPEIPLLEVDPIRVNLPEQIALQKQWRSQVHVRLGSDVSVIPGVLALRAGVSYESRGVKSGYENLDFQPLTQVGLHMGGTVRLWNRLDLSVAYAHIFQPAVTVGIDEAQYRRTVAGDPDPGDDTIVNAGRFTGRSDILIVQAGASF
ncbi:MAG: hypothetical protein H5U40_02650 [Polyangiaceae bacterium]|nr:hypothetical protein [Polyangiaceae bacterium]